MKIAILIALAVAVGAFALSAQVAAPAPAAVQARLPQVAEVAAAGNPLMTEAKAAYTQIKNVLTAMAAKMPPEDYNFKPVPEIRSFGELVAHIADTQIGTCSALTGERKTGNAASKTAKADLVAALQASFDECDAAWSATTEANAFELTRGGRVPRSRLGTLINIITVHDNEEYGYMSVYLRLRGIVPPSSENTGGRGTAAPGR